MMEKVKNSHFLISEILELILENPQQSWWSIHERQDPEATAIASIYPQVAPEMFVWGDSLSIPNIKLLRHKECNSIVYLPGLHGMIRSDLTPLFCLDTSRVMEFAHELSQVFPEIIENSPSDEKLTFFPGKAISSEEFIVYFIILHLADLGYQFELYPKTSEMYSKKKRKYFQSNLFS